MKITVTLTMTLQDNKSVPLDHGTSVEVASLTEDTIRNRLFGEGFLPDTIEVDEYEITSVVGDDQTGVPVAIKSTDSLGNVAFIRGTIGSSKWGCVLASGTAAAFSYAGVIPDRQVETQIALSRAKTPQEALEAVRSRSYNRSQAELV